MMWRDAQEVRSIAEALIDSVDVHRPLADARFEYLFMQKAPVSAGRLVWGRARKITGLAALFADPDYAVRDRFEPAAQFFVIEIAEPIWVDLDARQRRALVDHELCHCKLAYDDAGEMVLSTVGHDLEEFVGIVARHGLWSTSVESMAGAVAQQLTLAVDDLLDDVSREPGP